MASFGNDEINTKALDALNKTLKDSKVIVRVGILGGKNVRNNATYNQEKVNIKSIKSHLQIFLMQKLARRMNLVLQIYLSVHF